MLRKLRVLDYSLLVGVHCPHREAGGAAAAAATAEGEGEGEGDSEGKGEGGGGAPAPAGAEKAERGASSRPKPRAAAPGAPWTDYEDGGIEGAGPLPPGEREVYYAGIIDCLTRWSAAKAAETVARSVTNPLQRRGISCVPPGRYADRFEKACEAYF